MANSPKEATVASYVWKEGMIFFFKQKEENGLNTVKFGHTMLWSKWAMVLIQSVEKST